MKYNEDVKQWLRKFAGRTYIKCCYLPFMHEEYMRPSGNIWMNCHWKYELVIFAVEIVKVILDGNVRPDKAPQ